MNVVDLGLASKETKGFTPVPGVLDSYINGTPFYYRWWS